MRLPELSVVLAATDSDRAVARAVASLQEQDEAARVEIVVAATSDRIETASRPAGVRWIAAPPGSGVPRLRRLGLDAASAPVVAFAEDSCLYERGWISALLGAFDDPGLQAATGPVEPASGLSPVDWAVFFCEYAPFLRSDIARTRIAQPRLAGNNFAVRRRGLNALNRAEVHESEVRREVVDQAGVIRTIDGALARHVRSYSLREAIGDRLRFGLEFGRLRAERHSRAVNAAALLAGPAIFAVQLVRLTRLIFSRRRCRGRFVSGLPITVALLSAWSAGESLGWSSWAIRPGCTRYGRRARSSGRPGPSTPRCTTGRGTA